ncbi:hypothetical protein APA386B_5P4 (plasmid) [Acetobacter pasteurianus 386B]|nr:hypothetical protein APA386B_5P4 [Acetobacter pasteurianus 386B]
MSRQDNPAKNGCRPGASAARERRRPPVRASGWGLLFPAFHQHQQRGRFSLCCIPFGAA